MNSTFSFKPTILTFMLILMSFIITAPAAATGGKTPAMAAPAAKRPAMQKPRLHVAGAEQPVRLVSLAVRTEIKGGFAESSLDMVFFNPNPRTLEGTLEFPIEPGQEISGLALDINGELRRGVPVPKARGQEMFDEIARRKVDPALLESTGGNAYRLRVYPLPAGGKRRVVIRIMQPLESENGALRYRLPLAFADELESFTIEAEIVSPAGQVKAGADSFGLNLKRAGTIYRGRAEHKNITPDGWLDISLPAPDSLPASVTAARWGDKLYFSAAASLPLPNKARALPNKVAILWDASGSGLNRDQAKEFALLDEYFKTLGSGRVRLIVLRDKAEAPQTFNIKKSNWHELKETLKALPYDGATNLADWAPAADCREYLLFSDGLANYNGVAKKGHFPELAAGQRLFAINSAPTADYAALRAMAAGGALIDLAHETQGSAELKLLREGAAVSIDNSALAGAAEATLGPQSAYISPADGRGGLIRLAGWVKRGSGVKEVPVKVTFSNGSSKNISLPLPAWDETPEAAGEEAPLPARLWARYAIAGLEADYKPKPRSGNTPPQVDGNLSSAAGNGLDSPAAIKKAIAELSEQFGVVSRETSLIVLETAEDYARYGVKPPASLQAQVAALRRNRVPSGGEQKLSAKRLTSMWQTKVEWWEKSFKAKSNPTKIITDPLKFESDKVYTGERMSFNFQNADIHNIIRVIGEVSGKNIVVSDAVSGKVTLNLKNVPWDQALDIVLSSQNLSFEESGNVLTVYDLPTLNSIRAGRQERDARSAEILSVAPLSKENKSLLDTELEMAERDGDVKTISAPRIMAADGQKVTIKQGQQIPYKSGRSANTAANAGSFAGGTANASSINNVLGGGVTLQTRYSPNFDNEPAGGGSYKKQEAAVSQAFRPWSLDAPGLARMKAAKNDELYAVYLEERPAYMNSSAFFYDAAGLFFERGLKELGLRVISNLAEMQLENRRLLRMLAYRLIAAGDPATALPILEQVRELAPYEPQSLRDIATVMAALGRHQEAVDLLYEVATGQWSNRFGDINIIALTEMNAIIARNKGQVNTDGIDSRLIRNLPADLRVVLVWDADDTDLNLHVNAIFAGRISQNCTQGYGPEEFMLLETAPGVYRVKVFYNRDDRQTMRGEVTALVTVFRNFGTPEQTEKQITLRFSNPGDQALAAEFTVEEESPAEQ